MSPPAGASINPSNGVFSWWPAIAQPPSTNVIAVQVADNGTPAMSAAQNLTVTVLRPLTPALNSTAISNGNFSVLINGCAGPDYVLETNTSLAASAGMPFVTNLSVTPPFSWSEPVGAAPGQKFYRVRLAP